MWKTELLVGTKGSGPSWNLEVSGELTVSFSFGEGNVHILLSGVP